MKFPGKANSSDRRRSGDRRRATRNRAGAGRAVVIEVTRNLLTTAVLTKSGGDNPDSVTASSFAWRKESTDLRSLPALAELTAGFRKIVADHALQGAAVHIVLSGEYCVTRVLRGSSDKVRAELKELEHRSRMYLSLGAGEKALVTQVKQINARLTHALAVASHQDTLAVLSQAAEGSGLQIECIEPELTALGRAVSRLPDAPQAPYLLAIVDDRRCELGVCYDGELLIDYRPGGQFGPQDLARITDQHCSRLERYAARFITEGATRVQRLYLAGEPQAVALARQSLSSKAPFEVETVAGQQVQATWKIDAQSLPHVTATTLGGLLAAYYPPAQRDCPNLKEHLEARTRTPLRPRIVRSLAPLAAVLLASAGLFALKANEQSKVAEIQAQLDGLAVAQARANELRLQGMRSRAMLTQLELLAVQLPAKSGLAEIKLVANSMPEDVWLRDFLMTDLTRISLDGASYLEAGVYTFVGWLENAPGVREVALKGAAPGASDSGPVTQFLLELVLADESAPAPEVARRE
ncbi:MAG: hypothetical protein KF847_12365 [Pirellulales bacterium]|nr:hypothetical protein [Pirellulales bacterium]